MDVRVNLGLAAYCRDAGVIRRGDFFEPVEVKNGNGNGPIVVVKKIGVGESGELLEFPAPALEVRADGKPRFRKVFHRFSRKEEVAKAFGVEAVAEAEKK